MGRGWNLTSEQKLLAPGVYTRSENMQCVRIANIFVYSQSKDLQQKTKMCPYLRYSLQITIFWQMYPVEKASKVKHSLLSTRGCRKYILTSEFATFSILDHEERLPASLFKTLTMSPWVGSIS